MNRLRRIGRRAWAAVGAHPRPWIALAGLGLVGAGCALLSPALGMVAVGAALFVPAQIEHWMERWRK